MFNSYIVRRILLFIPTLFAISLVAFIISINAPGDPIEALFEGAKGGRAGSQQSIQLEAAKDTLRHELGLDLPVFYITLTTLAEPDTLYRIRDVNERENLARLLDHHGNWEEIEAWHQSLNALKLEAAKEVAPDSSTLAAITNDSVEYLSDHFYQIVLSLLRTHETAEIKSKLDFLSGEINRFSKYGAQNFLQHNSNALNHSIACFDAVETEASSWKNYIPALHFYGYNQYHRWLFGDGNMFTGHGAEHCKGVIRGDFGISYNTRKPVTQTIARVLPWSITFTIISVLIAYLISIPIGVQAAARRGSLFDRSSSVVLFMMYSLPTFLMGTLLLMTFANPDVFNILPSNGIEPATGIDPSAGWWERVTTRLPYFILPLICYTYSSLAFLSRTMRVAMLEVTGQDFIRTAKAKGLSHYLVMYKHGMRNALLPIITVFANVFPLAIGGSVILEYLFGIPGMGPEILTAVHQKDYAMIVAVFTLAGFMTLIGYLVADILYSIADPRISLKKK